MASAGSGKTYALTNRYIALASVCEPDSICALTFTRAAAGEFLDKILTKLACAASDPEFAAELSRQLCAIGARPMAGGDFLEILKRVAGKFPRLCLSTIDAFEMRLVNAFASELGMVSKVRVLDEFSAERLRSEILKILLRGVSKDEKTFRNFFEVVARANHGDVKRAMFGTLSAYVENAHAAYCENSDPRIWSGSYKDIECPLPERAWNAEEYARLFGLFIQSLPPGDSKSSARRFLSPFKTFFGKSGYCNIADTGTKPMSAIKEMIRDGSLKKLCAASAEDAPDFANTPVSAELPVTPRQLKLIYDMLSMLVGSSLAAAVETANAVGRIVSAYETIYALRARSRGEITFADFPILLSSPEAQFERGLAEYRMDCRYDHWLLDEFQDTSRMQWRVIENLVSEIHMEGDGARTVYYVGDVKQAIYSWRGGDPRLFSEIMNLGTIRDGESLNVSWRSSKPVIDAVNALFSSQNLADFNADAFARWAEIWKDHIPHKSRGENGCVMIAERGAEASEADDIFKIIEAADPKRRGMSCAVIVQRNEKLTEIVGGLRALARAKGLDWSVSGEVDARIAFDNMLIPAVLQLMRAAAHPTDTAAEGYVKMTPLKFATEPENWRIDILREIDGGGFAAFASRIVGELERRGACADAFTRSRARTLVFAAAEFDAGEFRDIDSFADFMEKYRVRETSRRSDIQVITFHKAKGLDYDIVIMPQMGEPRASSSALHLRKARLSDGREIMVNMPSRDLASFSPVLDTAAKADEADKMFERICMFYVGVTRAKKAVYFLVEEGARDGLGKKERKYTFERHVLKTVGAESADGVFAGLKAHVCFGDALWFEKENAPRDISKDDKSIAPVAGVRPIEIPEFVAPSSLSESAPRRPFSRLAQDSGSDFGTLAHSVLECLTYADSDGAALAEAAGGFEKTPAFEKALAMISSCLKNPAIAEFFAERGGAEIRNEYPFALWHDGVCEHGVFDKLNIYRDADGKVSKAVVIDFKSDSAEVSDAEIARQYAAQMRAYLRAAAEIFPGADVSVKIVRLRTASVIEYVL